VPSVRRNDKVKNIRMTPIVILSVAKNLKDEHFVRDSSLSFPLRHSVPSVRRRIPQTESAIDRWGPSTSATPALRMTGGKNAQDDRGHSDIFSLSF
jgi:hypothetical protein